MGVFARILLRVIAGFMIARGLPADLVSIVHEPEVAIGLEAILGALVWGAAEAFYWAAKRFGWRT
ncbi:MAG: hypothetical protein ACK4GT_19345 [Pararhodobacter sp.]